ncbi:MAG: hypothetical protein SOZ02_00215 [Hallerella porci]|nr:hypothetical protein [Hallerella porci]
MKIIELYSLPYMLIEACLQDSENTIPVFKMKKFIKPSLFTLTF